MLKQWIKGNNYLFQLALRWKEKQAKFKGLSEYQRTIVESLVADGVFIMDDVFNEEECQAFNDVFNALNSKYVREYDNDKRVYGIEKLDKIYQRYHENKVFREIGKAYVGEELIVQTTMAAKIIYEKNIKYGSGGGWHRDSFSKQFKVIVYTTDCTLENGPFQYLKGSHKIENIIELIKQRYSKINVSYPRYEEEEIEEMMRLGKYTLLTAVAKKGTVLLVDTRGIHRGSPMLDGERRSIFNYCIGKSDYIKSNNIEKLSEY